MITLLPFFLHFILFLLTILIIGVCSESVKMKIFFHFLLEFIKKLTSMVFRQFHISNNLQMHIRENTDFLLGKALEIAECQGEFQRL